MNRSGDIISALSAAGIAAYGAGGHEGRCLTPYCVVRVMSSLLSGGGGRTRYRVSVLVPEGRENELDSVAEAVENALEALVGQGVLAMTQPRGATVCDDRFRAVTTFIEYVSYYSK